jgi:hypothetical protein
MTDTSVQLVIPPPTLNGGSDILSYKIIYFKFDPPEPSEGVEEEDLSRIQLSKHHDDGDHDQVVVTLLDAKKLSHEVKGLKPGFYYRFQVTASNRCGESVPSDMSDPIRLGTHLLTFISAH